MDIIYDDLENKKKRPIMDRNNFAEKEKYRQDINNRKSGTQYDRYTDHQDLHYHLRPRDK